MAKIGVIGAGSWGIALAWLLINNGHEVQVWSAIESEIEMLKKEHEHKDKLPGVKIQVFHGYAAEKKDHWIIRRYFDTYFTQGPYFTSHFEASARKYGDFEVR